MRYGKRIAFVSEGDPTDRKTWSGTHYRVFCALQRHFEHVEPIGPVRSRFVRLYLGAVSLAINALRIRKNYNRHHGFVKAYVHSKIVQRRIRRGGYDAIFASAASPEVAYLNSPAPLFYLSDTSFLQYVDYYSSSAKYLELSLLESQRTEARALRKAKHAFYPSAWAADFAVTHYGKERKDVSIVPFGANIDDRHVPAGPEGQGSGPFHVLFVGVDWERKGGNIVLLTFYKLLENGYDVRLTICGCDPGLAHPRIEIHPWLDKGKEADVLTLVSIYRRSHVMFVPSQAECFGIVFCEASAFGIPSLTTDTGGIATAVHNHVNGIRLPVGSPVDDYYAVIQHWITTPEDYQRLRERSRKRYEQELSWESFGRSVAGKIGEILGWDVEPLRQANRGIP